MTLPFLIRHPDKREYELSDVAYFRDHYQPLGFVIVDPAPTGYTVPALPPDDEPREMTRAELNDAAAHLGIAHPEKMPNKDAVIAAITEKTAEFATANTDTTPVSNPESGGDEPPE